uniref:Putative autotransporter protein n=1 Tax=Desulfovibrio sp. U5L TaxID=596152 RepID=I2PZ00_9BACT
MHRPAAFPVVVLLFFFSLAFPQRSPADEQSEYDQAVVEAQANARNPSAWSVDNLKVITGPGSGDGNTYVGGKLVAATFTKESYNLGAFAGGPGLVYGTAATSATWVTIGGELKSHLAGLGVTAANVQLETSRALGMSATNSNNMIVEMLVTPDVNTIARPTKDPAVAAEPRSLGTNAAFVQPAGMSDGSFANFKAYYANWLAEAYGPSHFPWTQLGYTYLWGQGDALANIRGLSEFILPGGTSYTVYAMYPLTSYLYTTGNGSGDFHVTGDLDTLWAGRLFQPRGDTVRLDPGATVSGGQGLLVSSPGYTVVNNGTITGTTTTKFGLSGTQDMAVLFLGQTPTASALAAPAGSTNTLLNTGSIDSPGTAVRALAGDTVIRNIGSIAGGEYAVRTGDGADRLVVAGGLLSGRVDLGGGVDSLTATGTSTLAFSLSPLGTTPAPVQNVEVVRLGPGTSLALTFEKTGYVANAQTYTLINAQSLSVPASGLPVTSDLPMVRGVAVSDGANLTVTGLRDMGWYTRAAADHSLGAALDAAAATVNPAMEGLLGLLDRCGDPTGATAQLGPGPQTRATVLVVDAASAFSSAFAGRMRGLRGQSGEARGLRPAGFLDQDPGAGDLGDVSRSALSGRIEFGPSAWRAALPAGGGATPETVAEGRLEAFGSLYGGHGLGRAGGGAPGYDSDLTGAMGGVGIRALPGLRLGMLGGYAWSRADFTAGGGKSDDHIWRIGPYASFDFAPYAVDALLTYGAHQVHAERPIPFWGATANSQSTMRDLLAYLRAGRTVDLGAAFVAEPFLEAQYLRLFRQAYGESGAGAANLLFPAADSASLTSVLGLRLAKTFEWGNLALEPDVWGGWRHEYADVNPRVTAAFEGAPGQGFAAPGGNADRDQARFGAGLSLRASGGRSLSVRLDNTAGATRSDTALAVGVRLTF